jgi:hypothetical protein
VPATSSCPPVSELQRLARAQLNESAAALLQQHLQHCPRCVEIVRGFREETQPPRLSGKAVKQRLADLGILATGQHVSLRAAGMPLAPANAAPPQSSPTPAAAAAPAGNGASPASTANRPEDVLRLLGPRQLSDEIGRLGPYRLLKVLGQGATGIVFVAEDVQLRRPVALKVMKPISEGNDIARQRFLREAQAAAQLDHEHIVNIYQVGEDRGLPFLAMKLLQGETLHERLYRERQLPLPEVLRIGREVALGLDAAHERGLIHRDIKPANIFLEGPQARVKIVDFGLARPVTDNAHLTRTGTVVGTPAFLSPEQARGAPLDPRTDIFSLGGVLYCLCTGRTPFEAEDTMGMLMALSQEQPPPIRAMNAAVPEELVGLIGRMMAKLPAGRPRSGKEVAASLEQISQELAAPAKQGPVKQSPPRDASTPLWLTALQMAVLALVGGMLYWIVPGVLRAVSADLSPAAATSKER